MCLADSTRSITLISGLQESTLITNTFQLIKHENPAAAEMRQRSSMAQTKVFTSNAEGGIVGWSLYIQESAGTGAFGIGAIVEKFYKCL